MKKVSILIIVLSLAVCAIVTTFLFINKPNKVYAKSFSLTSRTFNVALNAEIKIADIDYEIVPTNCNQTFEFVYDAMYIEKTNNGFKAIKLGDTNLIFKIKSSTDFYIQDTLLINIVANNEPSTINFSVDNLQLSKDEVKDISSILTIENNSINQPTISYSIANIATLILNTKYITANNLGNTVITVSLQTTFGKISDSITVTVVNADYSDYSIVTNPSSINQIKNDYNIMISYEVKDGDANLATNQACTAVVISGQDIINITMNASGSLILQQLTTGTATVRLTSEAYGVYKDITIILT